MNIKQLFCISLIAFGATSLAFSDNSLEPLLNQVTVPFTADMWVKTSSAKIFVNINATIKDQSVSNMQNQILTKLNKITKAEWHLTSFNQSKDQSGLERVSATGFARVSQKLLGGLRDRAKSVSRPGETFTLGNISFVPSDAELRAANSVLRGNIYSQIKAEIAQLDKENQPQKYFLHQLNFSAVPTPFVARGNMLMAQMKSVSSPMVVSDHLQLTASAVLAAAPTDQVKQLVHGG